MSNYEARVEQFKSEITTLCEKYRIGMIGTCDMESIYGEITLFDMDHPDETSGWSESLKHHLNWS